MSILTLRISVSLNEKRDIATIRMSNTNPTVVPCLGVETHEDGSPKKIYVNAKLHNDNKHIDYQGWAMSGAISTILTKVVSPKQ